MNATRLESFSDGVFAFAITLLVLGIPVPELRSPDDFALRHALLHSLAQLVPYVTSFATVGIIWLNHHQLFHSVETVDHPALALNLLLLLVVSFVPYPTAILGKFGPMPSGCFLYGATFTLVGSVYSLLARHIHRNRLDVNLKSIADVRLRNLRNVAGVLTYSTAALIGLRWPRVSVAAYFLLAMFYFLPFANGGRESQTGRGDRASWD